jgi:anti-sigma-K factor RskA/putative zinc finger protein
MNASDHNRWSEDLAAYALGALDPPETADMERHLDGCDRCQQELRWLRPAVQALPETVERTEPSPGLRQSLMAEVRADARADARPKLRPASPRAGRRSWFLKPAMGFAVLALLVAGVVGYQVGQDGDGDKRGARTIVRQIDGMTVKMIQDGNAGTLELVGVPQLPKGKVLEAWVERDGKVEAVPALFVPDRRGHAETTIADMDGVDTVMVTEEPQGGSEAPTGEPIMSMAVPG